MKKTVKLGEKIRSLKTAKLVKHVSNGNPYAAQSLYRLTPVYKTKTGKKIRHVVVSTVNAPISGIETYIFPANKKGEIVSFLELPGSQRGTDKHGIALKDFGYFRES